MNVIIIEDEHIAFEKLKALLILVVPEVQIVGHAKSVQEGINLINTKPKIDLAFFDIQLEDGLSFSILEQAKGNFPIIFITAYDDYAIRAFDHYSIAYLLKPIQKSDLQKAFDKFRSTQVQPDYARILQAAIQDARKTNYKERFTVKIGDKIRLFDASDIACFFSRNKGSFLCTKEGKQHLVDYPLDQIESLIDPSKFFRANRKHIISIDTIEKVIRYTGSRQKVVLSCNFDEDIIVAREKVKAFKMWLEGES